jgi:hypothetical protein
MNTSVLVVAVAALAAVPAVGSAQRPASSASAGVPAVRFGAQASWGSDTDFGIGARATYGLGGLVPTLPLAVHASFDWFFPGSGQTFWEINGNVVYNFDVRTMPTITPYLGAGLSFAHWGFSGLASDNNLGFSLVGGAQFKMATSKLTPFAELRLDAHSGSQMVLTGGVLF